MLIWIWSTRLPHYGYICYYKKKWNTCTEYCPFNLWKLIQSFNLTYIIPKVWCQERKGNLVTIWYCTEIYLKVKWSWRVGGTSKIIVAGDTRKLVMVKFAIHLHSRISNDFKDMHKGQSMKSSPIEILLF